MHTGECLPEAATVNLCNISKWSSWQNSWEQFLKEQKPVCLVCLKPYEFSTVLGCDECIWHLIGDLRLSNKTLDQLKVGVLNISTGAAANDRLKYYNYTAHRLQVKAHKCKKINTNTWCIKKEKKKLIQYYCMNYGLNNVYCGNGCLWYKKNCHPALKFSLAPWCFLASFSPLFWYYGQKRP